MAGASRRLGVAVRDNGFGERRVGLLMPLIEPDNRASIRVAQRIGSRFVRECALNGSFCRVYGRAARG